MVGLLATVAWLAAAPPAAAQTVVAGPAHVFTADTRVAVVVSEKLPEVSFLAAHCEALQRHLEFSLSMPAVPPPLARIESDDVKGFGPVESRVVAGTVLIVVRLGDGLTAPERASAAAAQAWLARVALAGGQAASASEPWTRQALACETLAQLRPAMNDFWYREGRQEAPSTIVDIVAGRAPEREAFLFWRALRSVLGASSEQAKALIASAQGGSVLKLIGGFAKSPQEWWLIHRADLLLSRSPVSLGVRESAESLDDIARFVFDFGKGDELITGDGLLKYRALPAVRTSVAARLSSLRREILRQNPVYHNSWRTFGAWLEGFGSSTPEEFAHLWADYVAERRLADDLRKDVEAALAAPVTAPTAK
ncbi:MAG: hypothetical protein WCJ96_05765 [Verrucomicrobiota bacterium]|jgi:hypothetical protein